MTKNEAKEKIKGLIAKYERLKPAQIKRYNEATTRKDFIMPLFQTLGWDAYNHFGSDEVIEEESVVEGTVDYSFRLNNIPQFLLEAKALKIDLDKIQWAEQAESYAWNMGIDWVILTDFEGLKLFNAEWKKDSPHANKEFTYKEYLTKFDDLWFFSKESFQKGLLDKKAETWGIKAKRMEVTEKLARDLVKWREILFDNLYPWNEKKYNEEEIDEAVQRILDRFIFIRSCEDRRIEEKKLWPAFKKWELHKTDDNFIKVLKPIFKEFDEKYNSNLFVPHFCEDLETEGAAFIDVINDLYGDKESGVKYNFAAIKPDILGAVYEQYLGHLLEKVKKNQIAEEKAKRKKQGIYYTPTFIVDYIVENTLGKLIKEKSLTEIENLKILDPACGSGSFLIKAFDVLDKKLKEERSSRTSSEHALRKYRILTSNLYGVDLDEQAIEITRLNLLLKALEPKHKLPLLSENTKVGNSLISGTETELKKYFGKDVKKKKAFNWKEEFPNIFKDKNPGFDVVIGNPPWVTLLHKNLGSELNYLKDKYIAAQGFKLNLFPIFLERALEVCKKDGYVAFIIPNRLLDTPSYKKIREKIIKEYSIEFIVDIPEGSFKDVVAGNIIICIKKAKPQNEFIKIIRNITKDEEISFDIPIKDVINNDYVININIKPEAKEVLAKIKANTILLKDLFEVHVGMMIKDKKNVLKNRPEKGLTNTIVIGRDLNRHSILNEHYFNPSRVKIFGGTKRIDKHKTVPKILVRKTGNEITATIDRKGIFAEQSVYLVLPKEQLNLDYVVAILNSKLLNFYFRNQLITNPESYPYIQHYDLEKLPIYKVNLSDKKEKAKYDELVKLAKEILKLNKELQKTTEKSDKWYKIKKEIEKTDKIIDQKVYELYELTKKEIKIID